MIVECAKILKENGCQHFHIVTGHASNPDSIFFIPRIKGESEMKLQDLQFEKLFIYRPGLLRCQRSESRPLESMARMFSNLFDVKDWWSIEVQDVADVIVRISKTHKNYNTLNILEHRDIVSLK